MSGRRRKKPRRPERPEADRWAKASGFLTCSFGCQITPGMWIRFGRRGSVVCAASAKQNYGLEPPDRPFTFKGSAPEDVRGRQVGDE